MTIVFLLIICTLSRKFEFFLQRCPGMKYAYLLLFFVLIFHDLFWCAEKEEIRQLDGDGAIAYLHLPLELKQKIIEEIPLCKYQKKLTKKDRDVIYYRTDKVRQVLKHIHPATFIKPLLVLTDILPAREIKKRAGHLCFADVNGKKCSVSKIDVDTPIVGPFTIKGIEHIIIDTLLWYRSEGGDFVKSENQIPTGVRYLFDENRVGTKVLCAHPKGLYIITGNAIGEWHRVYQNEDGTFARERFFKNSKEALKAWPVSAQEVALLYGDMHDSKYVALFNFAENKIKKTVDIHAIFNKISEKFYAKFSEKVWDVYKKNIDFEKMVGQPDCVFCSLSDIDYIPISEKLALTITITGPTINLIYKEKSYSAVVKAFYSELLGQEWIKLEYEVIESTGDHFRKKLKIPYQIEEEKKASVARVIPYKMSKYQHFYHTHDKISEMEILIQAACAWLLKKDKKIEDGIGIVSFVNNPLYIGSTVFLNYISSYQEGQSHLPIVYTTLKQCRFLENIKKEKRVYLFEFVYNEVKKLLVKDIKKRIKNRKKHLTEEETKKEERFAHATYKNPLLFPQYTCIAEEELACAGMIKKQNLNRYDVLLTKNMEHRLERCIKNYDSVLSSPYKLIKQDKETCLYRMLWPNIKFARYAAAALETQNPKLLELI